MYSLLKNLWTNDAGFVLSGELVLVSTIGVLGMVAGLSEVANNVNGEMHDTAKAFAGLNQTYSVTGPNGSSSHYADSHSAN